jgi:hypothetical protein
VDDGNEPRCRAPLVGDTAQVGAESPGLVLRAFGTFEFTGLGVIVFAVGALYLVTVGVRLLPERIPADEDPVGEDALQEYLADVVVPAGSSPIGQTVREALDDLDIDVLQPIRRGERFDGPIARKATPRRRHAPTQDESRDARVHPERGGASADGRSANRGRPSLRRARTATTDRGRRTNADASDARAGRTAESPDERQPVLRVRSRSDRKRPDGSVH